MSRRRVLATIPEPYESLASLRSVALATKELVEGLSGQRGGPNDVAVTWGDLMRLGLIKQEQVPKEFGPYRPQ